MQSIVQETDVSILVFVDLALEGLLILAIPYRRTLVSILVFVDLALEATYRIAPKHLGDMFQSLFSWIWLSKFHHVSLSTGEPYCFNPCFRGSVLSKIMITLWT